MSDNSSMQAQQTTDSWASGRGKVMLFLKGVAMGLGDSVPGISGGTIAVITKIYDQLVFSIRAVDLRACELFFTGQFKAVWQYVNGTFLLILAMGILSGLLVSANTVLFLLENYFAPLMAFFIGMVLASCALLRHEFSLGAWQNLVALLLGLVLAVSIGFISPRSGLSGAFILLLLGVYEFILGALLSFDLPYILVFILGCAVGLLAFSRVLSWMLREHHQLSYGFITGMLLGSVSALWPWQEAEQGYPLLLPALLCLVLGVAVVVLLQVIFSTKPRERSS